MFYVIPGSQSTLKIKDFSTNKSYSVQTQSMYVRNDHKAANCIVYKKILLCGDNGPSVKYYKTA